MNPFSIQMYYRLVACLNGSTTISRQRSIAGRPHFSKLRYYNCPRKKILEGMGGLKMTAIHCSDKPMCCNFVFSELMGQDASVTRPIARERNG